MEKRRGSDGALEPGTLVGTYRIRRVIGRGGFGITYEGENRLGRVAAIKEFWPDDALIGEGGDSVAKADRQSIRDWALRKFEDTTVELSRFEHPNIVNVRDYIPDDGAGYMIMDLVKGETYGRFLQDHPDQSFEDVRRILAPIADALRYLHDRKIIHRDVKPDNIMVREDGVAILIDFGSLKAIETEMTRDAQSKGLTTAADAFTRRNTYLVYTPDFAAPEQRIHDAVLSPATDVYALASIIYRALSKAPLPDSDRRAHLIASGNDDPYQSIADTLRPGLDPLPSAVCRTIDKALRLNSRERPQAMRAFLEGLGWDASAPNRASELKTRVVAAEAEEKPVQAQEAPLPHAAADEQASARAGDKASEESSLSALAEAPASAKAEAPPPLPKAPPPPNRPKVAWLVAAGLVIAVGAFLFQNSREQNLIRNADTLTGARAYLSDCIFCFQRAEASALIAREESRESWTARLRAAGTDLAALERFIDSCSGDCPADLRTEASQQADGARRQRYERQLATAGTNVAALQKFLAECVRACPPQLRADAQQRMQGQQRADESVRTMRPTVQSAGIRITYSQQLLYVSPEANDIYDAGRRTNTTVWHSSQHGKDVSVFLQISPNENCQTPSGYADVIAQRNKLAAPTKWEGARLPDFDHSYLSGRSGDFGQSTEREILQWIVMRRAGRGTIVHIGGRFPPDLAPTYRAEIGAMIRSIQLPGQDLYEGRCT